jgi:hypothetical protein
MSHKSWFLDGILGVFSHTKRGPLTCMTGAPGACRLAYGPRHLASGGVLALVRGDRIQIRTAGIPRLPGASANVPVLLLRAQYL